ncbi:MAG: exodeoxyribonuclease VII small subunit [Deltaproteobacteria bacterium]|nr:exodeoxyribonuclease VII small subunit [Deltaproteobacteria bacterium]MBK8719253.1 exodeoxyribonuclease VII small subunit [Deltaproteobacteria bacterium]MBP7291211.1 exodeoxyribonuclease VII small subunit [Nannocystaceae bacterium]
MARATDKRTPSDTAGEPAAGPGIDAILEQLEQVVGDLEGGTLPLERALERFEQGVALARRGNALLERVEQRVETLLADRHQAVPLAERGEDED